MGRLMQALCPVENPSSRLRGNHSDRPRSEEREPHVACSVVSTGLHFRAVASMKKCMGNWGTRSGVDELVSFSIKNLPTMRLPSGLYCHDMPFRTRELRGESVRYSLMVLLGLQRAAAAGHAGLPEIDELRERCLSRRESFTPGDIGLALWADTRRDGSASDDLVDQLGRAVSDGQLGSLVGMEVAWMVIGLAHAAQSHTSAEPLLRRLTAHLQQDRRASSGLYFHDAASRVRRRLPNFATEIYTLLALTTLASKCLLPEARAAAERLAGHLVRLQLPDGGWPWIFDARRAIVVERYEIYTVHQDAMAPMALLDLWELTGDERWARAAVRGLAWSRGSNELGADLIRVDEGFAHRSIRRRSSWERVALVSNAVASRLAGRPLRGGAAEAEVNETSRPYHLGWILEAWADRDIAAVLGA